MRIKNQFLLSIVVFVIIASIIAVSVVVTQEQTNRSNSEAQIAQDIQTRANNLVYVSGDYFLYQDSQDLNLWQTEFSAISLDVSKLSVSNSEQRTLLNTIKTDAQSLNSSWSNVVSYLQNYPRNESVRDVPVFQDMWSAMSSQNQALIFNAQELSQNFKTQVDQSNLINIILISALVGLFGAYFVINYFITYRNTLHSISKLQEGIEVIGSGNLDHSVKAGNNDEISEISGSVNQMASNLKAVTASKAELETSQAALSKSEQRWATTLSSIGDAVIATNLEGNITFMNNVAQSMTGWSLTEATGRPMQEVFRIVNEQTRLEGENPVTKVLSIGVVVGLANHSILLRRDGTEVPIDDSGSPIKDKNGQVTGVVLVFHDITERKKSEEEVKASENKYHSLFANMMDGFAFCQMIFDDQGRPEDFIYLEINDAFERLTGLRREKVVGRRVSEAIPGTREAAPEIFEIYGRVSKTGNPERFELFFKPLSIWLDIGVYSPKAGYFVAVFENITDRKKAEEALRESLDRENLLADLVRNASVAVAVGYPDGTIGMVNQAFERLTGYTKEELSKITWNRTLTPPEYIDFEKRKLAEVNLTKKPVRYEKEYIRKDGSRVPIELITHPFIDNQGNVTHYFAFINDLTERKKAEEALKSSEQNYKHLLEYAPTAIYEIDYKVPKFKSVNDGMCRLTGYTREELLAMNPMNLLTPESQELFRGRIKAILSGGSIGESVEYRTIRKDGRELDTVLYSKLTYKDGEPDGALVVGYDITERKKAEEALKERTKQLELTQKKLEENSCLLEEYANQMETLAKERLDKLKDAERLAAIGATAGMVGHDIRNPLQAITGDAFLAKQELKALSDSEQKKMALESIVEIEKNTEYINKIVQDLQDYARPLNPKIEESDLNQVFESILKKNGVPSNIDVKVKISKDARALKADTYYLNRIMTNLITNSVQAMPQGGKLKINAHKEKGETVITVEDTGVGIPKDVQAKMFTVMFTTKSKGQGFGLPVVKRMTESLGGNVRFTSEEGKGTTFIIRLPPQRDKR